MSSRSTIIFSPNGNESHHQQNNALSRRPRHKRGKVSIISVAQMSKKKGSSVMSDSSLIMACDGMMKEDYVGQRMKKNALISPNTTTLTCLNDEINHNNERNIYKTGNATSSSSSLSPKSTMKTCTSNIIETMQGSVEDSQNHQVKRRQMKMMTTRGQQMRQQKSGRLYFEGDYWRGNDSSSIIATSARATSDKSRTNRKMIKQQKSCKYAAKPHSYYYGDGRGPPPPLALPDYMSSPRGNFHRPNLLDQARIFRNQQPVARHRQMKLVQKIEREKAQHHNILERGWGKEVARKLFLDTVSTSSTSSSQTQSQPQSLLRSPLPSTSPSSS